MISLHKIAFYFILTILIIIPQTNQFIVGTNKGFRKCYFSDVSHDKTLDVRFGFARRERQNCKFQLTIEYLADTKTQIQGEQQKDTKLYDGTFICYDMNPRQPFVYKHTPTQHQYSGTYRICVQNLDDQNHHGNNTMFQLQISQKFDPALMIDSITTPLVQTAELIQMDTNILMIKRTLSWCQAHIKQAETVGDMLVKNLIQASQMSKTMTYLQIIFILFYGVVWVAFFRGICK